MYSVYPPKMRFEGSEMGSRSRGTYGSQQYRGGGGDDFFPRYDSNRARESTRTTRNAPAAPATYRGRVESEFRSARGYEADRKRDYPNGREMDRTKSINEKRSADTRYEGGRRGDARDVERSIHSRSNGNDRGAEARMSDSSGNRYKYLDEGWYNAYKPPTSISTYPEASHDYRTSRNGYESQPPTRDTRDRYRYGKGAEPAYGTGIDMGQYGIVNSEIVMETRQLEERVAAIQRELEMLEKDNVGSRSTDYRSSRNAYSANPSGNLPSLLDFAPPPDAVEKARIEREEVHLRMREEELRRREQELIMEQQRAIRQRAAPTTQYRRIAPPSRPKNATFPKLRSSITRRPVLTKRMNKSSSRRKLPERRRVEKTREKSRKDVKLPAKQKRTVKREVKEENTSKKKASGAEDPSKKSGHDRTTEGLIEQILGKYKREGLLPRTRYLKKLFEFCDVNLLEDELCREATALIPKVQLPTKDDYKTRTCIRTYNPTVFGPLDQYVPLGLFEEEVKVHDIANDTESDKDRYSSKYVGGLTMRHFQILADLRKALAGFPESSAA